jgi:erythronate-4-phosphate dehydrogenase
MHILCEDSLLYGKEFFESLGDFNSFATGELSPEDLRHTEVLLVRSTTQVNQSLLSQAEQLKFVGTATAGSDHLDLTYLKSRGIHYATAAGCNAQSVAEYVLSAFIATCRRHNWHWQEKSIGIVGAGHVGSALAVLCEILSIEYCLCDPPLLASGDPRSLVSLEQIWQSDFISLHVPLSKKGVHSTYHLVDESKIDALRAHQVLINASRGEVLDNLATLRLKKRGHPFKLVLDVWENEPEILWPLVEYTELATPHIAGHSLEGKAKGSAFLYRQLKQRYALKQTVQLSDLLPNTPPLHLGTGNIDKVLTDLIFKIYDIRQDDQSMRAQQSSQGFKYQRKHYGSRREFSAYKVKNTLPHLDVILRELGFEIS